MSRDALDTPQQTDTLQIPWLFSFQAQGYTCAARDVAVQAGLPAGNRSPGLQQAESQRGHQDIARP